MVNKVITRNGEIEKKISVQPHSSFCIWFLDQENNTKKQVEIGFETRASF